MLFNSANLPYWIFLGTGILLFLLVIMSGGGDEDLDVDTDVDVDVDLDVDADNGILDLHTDTDADLNGETEGEFNPLQMLGWLGLGKAPLILLLAIDFSTWGVTGWMLNVAMGEITGKIPGGFLGGIILFISLSFSLFLGSLISRPLGKIFASFGEDVSSDRLVGCMGTVTSKQVPYLTEGKIAQADVFDRAHNLVTINITLPHWATVIPYRGQEIIIIDRTEHSYLAIAKDSSDQDKWLANSKQVKDSF